MACPGGPAGPAGRARAEALDGPLPTFVTGELSAFSTCGDLVDTVLPPVRYRQWVLSFAGPMSVRLGYIDQGIDRADDIDPGLSGCLSLSLGGPPPMATATAPPVPQPLTATAFGMSLHPT